MVQHSIGYAGGIDDKELGVSLTGSETDYIIHFSNYEKLRIGIDDGAFQGGPNADEFNAKSAEEKAKDLDVLVLTHAHLDHVGRLPMLVKAGFRGPIFMTDATRKCIEPILYDSLSIMQKEQEMIDKGNAELRKELKVSLQIVGAIEALKQGNLEDKKKRKYEKVLSRYTNVGESTEGLYQEAQEFLKLHEVKEASDIEGALNQNKALLFEEEDIIQLFSQVKTLNYGEETLLSGDKKGINEQVKMHFIDAAHIEGSAQAVIETYHNTKRAANDILSKTDEDTVDRVIFSGDLGKKDVDSNRLGQPSIPAKPINYYQIESTYAGRNHLPRHIAEAELLYNIEETSGKVLIPTFAQQRTQEILLVLLERMLEDNDSVQLSSRLQESLGKYEELLGEEEGKNDGGDKERIASLKKAIRYTKGEISQVGARSFNHDIIVDSALGQKLTDVYIDINGERYNLLKPETQKKLFGRVVIKFLEPGEFTSLYNDKNKDKKQIILSSSGMMSGGAVTNHIGPIVSDKRNAIVHVGYQAEGTIGRELLDGSNHVIVEGIKHEVKCDVKSVQGFSAHIGHDEILAHIGEMVEKNLFKQNAVLALTHGTLEGRKVLKDALGIMLEEKGRSDIQIHIPELLTGIDLNSNDNSYRIRDSFFDAPSDDILKRNHSLKPENSIINIGQFKTLPALYSKVSELDEQEKDLSSSLARKKAYAQSLKRELDTAYKNIKPFEKNKQQLIEEKLTLEGKAEKIDEEGKLRLMEINTELGKNQKEMDMFTPIRDEKLIKIDENQGAVSQLEGTIISLRRGIKDFKRKISRLENYVPSYLEVNLSSEKDSQNGEELSEENQEEAKEPYVKKILKDQISSRLKETIKRTDTFFCNIAGLYKNIFNELFQKSENYKQISVTFSQIGKLSQVQKRKFNTFLKSVKDCEPTVFSSQKEKAVIVLSDDDFDNLYSDGKVRMAQLQSMLEDNYFSETEKTDLIAAIKKVESKDKRKQKSGQRVLNSILARKKEGTVSKRNLGINIDLDIYQLEKDIQSLLEEFFNKDYYNGYIKNNFDVIAFLKSGKNLKQYIEKKYSLTELILSDEKISQVETYQGYENIFKKIAQNLYQSSMLGNKRKNKTLPRKIIDSGTDDSYLEDMQMLYNITVDMIEEEDLEKLKLLIHGFDETLRNI